MEPWYPIVIGTIAFAYIQLFNWNAKNNGENGDRTRAFFNSSS